MVYIKKHYGLLIVFLVSLLPLLNLLNPGLPITHDGVDHVARIANFYDSLSEGILIPRWAENLNWGFGHPVVMFLYPMPSYITSIFHFLGFTLVSGLKLTFALTYILSGIFFYLWLSRFLKINAAILGAILYLFAPYRFVDLYVRGAIGEHVAFMFFPLVLLGLHLLFNIKSQYRIKYLFLIFLLISFSASGLILSHNGLSLLFLPFIVFYIFYLLYENKSIRNLLIGFFSIGYGFLISFFFWFPAFFEGKYTLRDVVTKDVYLDRFIEFKDLIYSPWGYGATGGFTTQIGFVQIILIIISFYILYLLFKSKIKIKYLLIFTLIYFFASMFLILNQSKFIWEIITLIQKLQFPWRLLAITTFSTSLAGAITVNYFNFKYSKQIIILLTFVAVISTFSFWNAKENKQIDETIFKIPYASTTDTGESSPIWSIRSMDEFPNDNLEILEGIASVENLERNSIKHVYKIDAKEKVKIRENTLYFPGWNIYVNGSIIVPEFQDPQNRGLMTFYVNEGISEVVVKFEDTKIRRIANIISIITIILIPISIITFMLIPKNKLKKYKW